MRRQEEGAGSTFASPLIANPQLCRHLQLTAMLKQATSSTCLLNPSREGSGIEQGKAWGTAHCLPTAAKKGQVTHDKFHIPSAKVSKLGYPDILSLRVGCVCVCFLHCSVKIILELWPLSLLLRLVTLPSRFWILFTLTVVVCMRSSRRHFIKKLSRNQEGRSSQIFISRIKK
jgi:hypothetical protein